MFADFEKAFDTISWSFLFKIMTKLGFGDKFMALYKKPTKEFLLTFLIMGT